MAPKVLTENQIARIKHEDLLVACAEWNVDIESHWRQLEIRAALCRAIYDATHPAESETSGSQRGLG